MKKKLISILLPDLGGGGAERAYLDLAYEFKILNYSVEFILMRSEGKLLAEAKQNFLIYNLNCKRIRTLPLKLINYINGHQPDIFIVSMWPLTFIVPFMKLFCNHKYKALICEQNFISNQYKNKSFLKFAFMRISMALGYRLADFRLGVSLGVVKDIARLSFMSSKKFKIIHNPISKRFYTKKYDPKKIDSLWACPPGARIIHVGSFKSQKNHTLLLNSFSNLDIPNARLMLLGEGDKKISISYLARKLGIADKVIFVGFQENPYPFYKSADLFVLTSDYEGFGNVIVEALASGTPVVSTDCPSGPAEILDNGRYGLLVPVRDEGSLTKAIRLQLKSPVNKKLLKKRASDFSANLSAKKYLMALNEIR